MCNCPMCHVMFFIFFFFLWKVLGHLWVGHDFTFPLLTYWILEVFSDCIFYNCEGTLLSMIIFKYPTIKGDNFDWAFVNMIIFKYPTINIYIYIVYSLCFGIFYVINYMILVNIIYFCHVMRLGGWTTIACLGLFPCFWPKSFSLLSCKYGFRCFSLYVHQFFCLSLVCLEN